MLQAKFRGLPVGEKGRGKEHRQDAYATLLAEAEPLMRRAREIFIASLGENHPNSLTLIANYRLLLAEMEESKGN